MMLILLLTSNVWVSYAQLTIFIYQYNGYIVVTRLQQGNSYPRHMLEHIGISLHDGLRDISRATQFHPGVLEGVFLGLDQAYIYIYMIQALLILLLLLLLLLLLSSCHIYRTHVTHHHNHNHLLSVVLHSCYPQTEFFLFLYLYIFQNGPTETVPVLLSYYYIPYTLTIYIQVPGLY